VVGQTTQSPVFHTGKTRSQAKSYIVTCHKESVQRNDANKAVKPKLYTGVGKADSQNEEDSFSSFICC
jgi:hypothetical protein